MQSNMIDSIAFYYRFLADPFGCSRRGRSDAAAAVAQLDRATS